MTPDPQRSLPLRQRPHVQTLLPRMPMERAATIEVVNELVAEREDPPVVMAEEALRNVEDEALRELFLERLDRRERPTEPCNTDGDPIALQARRPQPPHERTRHRRPEELELALRVVVAR